MKKPLRGVLTAVTVLGLAWAALAQQGDTARQRWQQWRETQNKAIATIQADAVKLRAGFEEAGRALPTPEQWESMSEQERDKLRQAGRTRWEEQQRILADLEQQIAVLKGPRQLKLQCDAAVQELAAIRDLARQEKASQAAERIQKLIDRRQAECEQIVQQIGGQR
jgi:hypothetical protein